MCTRLLRTTAIAVAMLALGVSLQAQGRGPGSGPGRGQGRGLLALNLTEAQQAQVKAIHERHQAEIQARQEAARSARTAMHQALAKEGTDAATLQALHQKVSAAQFDLMMARRAVRQEILPLLTPEQKARFEQRPMGPRGGRGGRPGAGRGLNSDCPMGKAF